MAIDRPQYIKLYSIAMEEVRHHHRLYTEIWSASALGGEASYAKGHNQTANCRPRLWVYQE